MDCKLEVSSRVVVSSPKLPCCAASLTYSSVDCIYSQALDQVCMLSRSYSSWTHGVYVCVILGIFVCVFPLRNHEFNSLLTWNKPTRGKCVSRSGELVSIVLVPPPRLIAWSVYLYNDVKQLFLFLQMLLG